MKELFRNETVLKYFISAVLEIPIRDIDTVRLKNTFLWRQHRKQKQGILDVLVQMNDSTKINIELQVKHYANWDKRQLFYLAQIYVEDLRIGDDYSALKRCVAISILDFNLTDQEEYHHVYRLRDAQGRDFSDMLEVHVLELRKKLKETGDVEEWIQFFRADSEEDMDMIKTKNPGILEAIREVKTMSLSRRLRMRYEWHLKQMRDEKAWKTYERAEARQEGLAEGLVEGREKGLAEGREEGREKGRAEERLNMIRRMLEEGMPEEDILKYSGCTREELDYIKKS